MEELPQRLQRVEGRFLERLVAISAQVRFHIGHAVFEQLTIARRQNLAVVLLDFPAAL